MRVLSVPQAPRGDVLASTSLPMATDPIFGWLESGFGEEGQAGRGEEEEEEEERCKANTGKERGGLLWLCR